MMSQRRLKCLLLALAVVVSATVRDWKDNQGNVMAAQVFTWTSLDPDAVSVDQSGRATAIGNSQTTTRASSGGVSGPSRITADNDFDDDGIPNTVDSCPNEPETVNNLSDSDCCADDSLEFY